MCSVLDHGEAMSARDLHPRAHVAGEAAVVQHEDLVGLIVVILFILSLFGLR